MEMTKNEIVRNYREAKDKRGQITILAHLNACRVDEIKQILKDAGETLPRGPITKKSAKETAEPKMASSDAPADYKDGKEAAFPTKTKAPEKPISYNRWLRARQKDIASYLQHALSRLSVLDDDLVNEYQDLAKIDIIKPSST